MYCIFLGDSLILWQSSKQKVVSQSSIESEYRAMALVYIEFTWISSLQSYLLVHLVATPVLLTDNIGVNALAHNPVFYAHTKYIEVDHHFIHD